MLIMPVWQPFFNVLPFGTCVAISNNLSLINKSFFYFKHMQSFDNLKYKLKYPVSWKILPPVYHQITLFVPNNAINYHNIFKISI